MAVKSREAGEPLIPSWRHLLERAADHLDKQARAKYANAVRALLELDAADYLAIAQHARDGLIGSNWTDFLNSQFRHKRESVDDRSLDLARAVWALGSPLVITTNYDNVLRWACPWPDDLETWDIEAPSDQLSFLQGGEIPPTVWHLHGKVDNKAGIILTLDGYKHLYPETGGKTERAHSAALNTLRSALASYTFLFIGFSLDDNHFGMQLKGINEIYKGMAGPHFVLAREGDRARIESLDSSLQVIPFENFGAPLLQLVRRLGEFAPAQSFSRGTAKAPPADMASPHVADFGPQHSVFSVPYRQKGDQLIGRENALQKVHTELAEGRRTAIGQAVSFEGLGGLGKTQLAIEYAYRYEREYPNGVIWLNADLNIDAQLTELAERARWVAPETEHKYKLEVAKNRLRTYSECLIIFDNLENIDDIRSYLPEPTATPHILVTSRLDQPSFNPIYIDPLDVDLSLKLLFQEAGRETTGEDERRAATHIVEELGGLPLALELAGAYLRHRQVSLQQYLELLKQNPRAVLKGRFPTFTKQDQDIYSTLKVNEEIFKEEPKLRDILDLFAWSGSSPMGTPLMARLLGVESETDLTSALGLGGQLRILKKTSDSDSYLVHRLVSRVRREEIPLETRSSWVNEVCQRLGDWFQELREDFLQLPKFEAELPHLSAWQEQSTVHAPLHASRLIWLQAYPPYHRGQAREAKPLVERALEMYKQTSLEDDVLRAHLINDIGTCSNGVGNYKIGLEYHERALEIRRRLFGERHPETARSLINTGASYKNLGDFRKALEYTERALEFLRETHRERHPETARSLSSIGVIYSELGDYIKALEHHELALEIRRETRGEGHPETAMSLSNVGDTYSKLGEYSKALEYHEHALEIHRAALGERHPNTAMSLSNVGGVYSDLGEYIKALEHHELALEIRRAALGERHPDTAISLSDVGSVYNILGDYRKALEYAEHALEIRRAALGERHPGTAMSLTNLGTVYSDLGEYIKALEHHELALEILLETLEEYHLYTAITANNIAVAYTNLGDFRKGFQYHERSLAIRRKVLGERHPDTAFGLSSLGSAYANLGDYEKARECIEGALSIQTDLLGATHPQTIDTAINIAIMHSNMNNPLKAFQILTRILRGIPNSHIRYVRVKEFSDEIRNRLPGFRHSKRSPKKRK